MERKKQILILALAIFILIFGIYIISVKISKESQVPTASIPASKEQEVDKKIGRDIFTQDRAEKSGNTVQAMGSVVLIGEKTLTVKHSEQETIVNINGATPVVIVSINNAMTTAQLADVRVGDFVEILYDQVTKDVKTIKLMRP